MRKAIYGVLSAALLWGTWSLQPARAEEEKDPGKPAAVLSFSGYNELKADLKYLGGVVGRPQLSEMFEGLVKTLTGGRDLSGLDKGRPWGIAIYVNPKELDQQTVDWSKAVFPILFVPVTDVESLAESLQPALGEPEEMDGGIYRVEEQFHHRPIFARPEGDWVFFSAHEEQLKQLPEKPQDLLGNLPKQYDLALQVRPGNVPEQAGRKLVAHLHEAWPAECQEAVCEHMGQLEQFTVGIAVNKDGKTYVEASAAASSGSEVAQRLASLAEAKTHFAGFLGIDATLKANWVFNLSEEEAEDAGQFLDQVQKRASEHLEERAGEHAKIGKALVDALMALAHGFYAAGSIDGGMALVLKPDAATMVIGGRIQDRAQLEGRLNGVAESLKSEAPQFAEKALTVDADEHQGVSLHIVELPIPEGAPNRERLVSLLGEKVSVIVGIGDDSAYLAMGKDAAATLKSVITQSQEAKTALPLQASLGAGSLVKFVAQRAPQDGVRARAQRHAEALGKSEGADRISAVVSPIERGLSLRLEIQEGVLKAAVPAPKAEP